MTLNMLEVMFKLIVIIAGVIFILVGIYLVNTALNIKRAKKKGSINATIEVRDVNPLQIESKEE